MYEKIRKVEHLFRQLEKENAKFVKQSGLHCLTNCTTCCQKEGLEANVLEFMPLAWHLVKNNLHEQVLGQLDTSPKHCVNLSVLQIHGQTGGCSVYPNRGLICRLFGFSGVRNKIGALSVYTCALMKEDQSEEYAQTNEKINNGLKIPIVADYYTQLYAIDPTLANDYNPINETIRKAIEKVAYYYSYKPKRPYSYKKTG